MATYGATDHSPSIPAGSTEHSFLTKKTIQATIRELLQAHARFINRGRNTGGGPAFVYWLSPDAPDPAGTYYNGSVPFGQLADLVAVGPTFLE